MAGSWTFAHIGLTVRDIDKAITHYQSIGAVVVKSPSVTNFNLNEWKIYGKTPEKLKLKVAVLKLKSLRIEVFQPLEGDNTWKEFLTKYGEGIDHVAFIVDDLKAEYKKMTAKGFPAVKSVTLEGDNLISAYFDTRKVGGILVELTNLKPE